MSVKPYLTGFYSNYQLVPFFHSHCILDFNSLLNSDFTVSVFLRSLELSLKLRLYNTCHVAIIECLKSGTSTKIFLLKGKNLGTSTKL